jgi:sterol desaturase/sphingolipid hydroxylase (fatty acid hydroxylase superfamily)
MIAASEAWLLSELPLFALTIAGTHLTISCSQTLMHYWLGHRRLGGVFFRNHINFHHAYYARGHLASASYQGKEGNNTPFFLIPTFLVGTAAFFLLPLGLFLALVATAAASFYAHVYFDKAYHVEGTLLERFAWFRRKQQLHFVHHLHANSNFAVIDFFWDRLLGTYRRPDRDI